MAKRGKLPIRKSKKIFTKHASKTHKKNVYSSGGASRMPMRGGIRL